MKEQLVNTPPRTGDEERDWAEAIREFHLAGQGPAMPDDPPPDEPLWPAAVHGLEAQGESAYAFPFLLPEPSGEENKGPRPLREVLGQALETCRQDGAETLLLESHLEKIVHLADRWDWTQPSAPAASVLEEALQRFLDSFGDSSQAARRELAQEVEALRRHLPREGALVAFHPLAPLVLYAWSLTRGRHQAARELSREVRRLSTELEGRLESDTRLKGEDADHISHSMGEQGDALLDAAALSDLLPPKRGSRPLEPQRRERMEKALQDLREHLEAWRNEPPFYLLHRGSPPTLPGLETKALQRHREPLQAAPDFFDELMGRRLRVLRAMRIAALEIEGRYTPELHDAVFKRFQWQSCSEEELRAMPPVVVLESAQRLSGRAMSDLSQVLGSSRPIHVLALNDDPLTRLSGDQLDLSTGYLPDLGYLAMAHREAFVLQGTLVRPGLLLEGLGKLSQTLDPSLALIWVPEAADASPKQEAQKVPSHRWSWMLGWSAHAGRAATCFTYSPADGLTWAERFDLRGNPQPESLCPTYRVPFQDAEGREQELDVSLTLAHAAALNPNYRRHFRVIPRQAWEEEGEESAGRPRQMDIAGYLEQFDQTPPSAVPYLWVLDQDMTPRRAVMTREMAAACRDRKRSWRMLQELAGVNNEYVRRAEAKLRKELEERLLAEQEALLEEARKQGAEEAIDRLVGILTGVEMAPAGDLAAPSLAEEAAAQEPAHEKAAASHDPDSGGQAVSPGGGPAAPDDDGFEEPYIDTILCTSCNDCIQLNPLLFKYNGDKQAEIADAGAGTYAQLVQAAENCPAHCIHPGTPRPEDATATPEMVARAQALEG
ncbi:MAG TPA: ferredoxin [Acidobacteriota bacterium]|nr:ferredoxin [Acidobacteriota bacterium]